MTTGVVGSSSLVLRGSFVKSGPQIGRMGSARASTSVNDGPLAEVHSPAFPGVRTSSRSGSRASVYGTEGQRFGTGHDPGRAHGSLGRPRELRAEAPAAVPVNCAADAGDRVAMDDVALR